MKNMKLRNFVILIRFILLSIAFTLIYLLIWHSVIEAINNENIAFRCKVVFAIIGFNLTYYYEQNINMNRICRFIQGENLRLTYNFKINFILKIIITPIAIPLFISTYVCDWITDYIYKDEDVNNISTKTYFTNVNYNNDLKDNYYCEMCFKKITENEFENFDGMCEECFEAENFDNL